jgi:hypothetical protein
VLVRSGLPCRVEAETEARANLRALSGVESKPRPHGMRRKNSQVFSRQKRKLGAQCGLGIPAFPEEGGEFSQFAL